MRRLVMRAICSVGAALLAAGCGSAAAGSGGGSAAVGTGTASVSGSSEQVLTDSAGRTLYYFGPDTPSTSMCTGTCAGIWSPLLVTSGQPTSSSSLPGSLTAVTDANGRQTEYQGHLLYTYSGDSAAGQASGDGRTLNGGIWHAATPSLTTGSGATGTPTASATPTPTTAYGGGY